jgi:hypothetical protein
MREERKEPRPKYRFLLDRDVSKSASLFPVKRTRTIAQVDLPENATDFQIVQKVWDLRLTIVTANGDDFVREINSFLNQTKRVDCHEMFGLVILPNGYENHRRLLPEIEQKLRLDGKKVTWTVPT